MPKPLRNVTSSGVANRNTPESDAQEFVEHHVSGSNLDDKEAWCVLVMATDPMDAIERVVSMPQDDFDALPRIDDLMDFVKKRFTRLAP